MVRSISFNCTESIIPNIPYPPIANENKSKFSSLEHFSLSPLGVTMLKATTSSMIGFLFKTLPCMFEDSAPPKVKLSAPVCFCIMVRGAVEPICLVFSHSTNSVQVTPPSAHTVLEFLSKAHILVRFFELIEIDFSANCCPPIEWRAPAGQIGMPSAEEIFNIFLISSTVAGVDTDCTDVSFNLD